MLYSGFFRNGCSTYSHFLFLICAFFVMGCSHDHDGSVRGPKSVNAVLDQVESIIDDDASMADSLIRLINPNTIRTKETQARYALLSTAVDYKNYQDILSDSLIMTAVRYYSIGNNINYRFLSYYYLGGVYFDLDRLRDAALAYTQAEQLADRIDNDHWKGLLYSQIGDVFNKSCDYHRAHDYYLGAVSCYESAGKELHKLYAMLDVGRTEINMQEFISADSILRIVENRSFEIGNSDLHSQCLYRRLSCLAYMNEPDSMTSLLDKYGLTIDEMPNSFGMIETKVQYYIEKKDYEKSESLLEQARLCDLTEDDSIHLFFASSRLATSQGQIDKALEYYREYNSLQNSSLRNILSQPILGAQKEQYRVMAENELLKYRHARLTVILCAVIFMLIIVIVLVTYHYKKKRMKEQLYESMAVAEELTDKIEDLKNQVRVQFRERHDLSNRLYSMYYDSENQDKITKQQLNVTINSLIKDYTASDNVRKLDKLLNESYNGIMDRLVDPQLGLSDKELELFRYSFAGLSSKSVSVIIKESPQNIYQIKSRLLKKVRHYSEDLWSQLNAIW